MSEPIPSSCDSVNLANPPELATVVGAPTPEPNDVLNDDLMIDVAPDRPCGLIRVRLVYAGRSTPIPADDPWAE